MRKFIFNVFGFSFVVLLSIYTYFCLADCTTDDAYLKFTTVQQKSLIIGSSIAAQGIHPKQLNAILNRNDVYNYAFSLTDSPYGLAYFESIKKKTSSNTKNGLFVLEVNPWVLGLSKNPETLEVYLTEANSYIQNTSNVCQYPNIEYLLESYKKKYIEIILNKRKKYNNGTYFVENDGRLNVTIEKNSIYIRKRQLKKIEKYEKLQKDYYGLSYFRFSYFIKLIEFLKPHGKVYLVRVPVIKELHAIENQWLPEFDSLMINVTKAYSLSYINLMDQNEKYTYKDGNHLDFNSGEQFSKDLAQKIKKLQD